MPGAKYSSKQKKMAAVAAPRNKITGADFAKLRGKKKPAMGAAKKKKRRG